MIVLLAIGIGLYTVSQSVVVPTSPTTLCPTKRAPTEVVVILLDASDAFSEPQRLQVQNHLARVRNDVPRFGLVEVYTLDRLGRRVTEPVLHMCNPGTGEDLNRVYQNPELAKRKWQGFADSLQKEIDHVISLSDEATSPIFEGVQATALRTFGKPEYDGLPKHLVIVSDLLQNTPGELSMYDRVPPFEQFRTTPYFSRVRADLRGVSVFVYYLVRANVPTQNRGHITFWDNYFQAQGATLETVDKVFGDK